MQASSLASPSHGCSKHTGIPTLISQNQLAIPLVYSDLCFNLPHALAKKNLPHAVTEGRKITGFRGCQGHKISMALSNSSNNLAMLSCKNSVTLSLWKCVIEGLHSTITMPKKYAGVCTSLLDVLVASPSGISI